MWFYTHPRGNKTMESDVCGPVCGGAPSMPVVVRHIPIDTREENRRRRVYEMGKKLETMAEEKKKLELENARLSLLITEKQNQSMSTTLRAPGTSPIKQSVPSPVPAEDELLRKKVEEETKKKVAEKERMIKKGIEEMREMARQEKLLRMKTVVKRRLSAAVLSNDTQFLRKILSDMRENVKMFDVTELDEYWKISEKLKEVEKKKESEKKEELESCYEKFDQFSVPDEKKEQFQMTPLKRIPGEQEEQMVATPLSVKRKRKHDDLMISSIYAIENTVHKQQGKDIEEDEELKELMEDFYVL